MNQDQQSCTMRVEWDSRMDSIQEAYLGTRICFEGDLREPGVGESRFWDGISAFVYCHNVMTQNQQASNQVIWGWLIGANPVQPKLICMMKSAQLLWNLTEEISWQDWVKLGRPYIGCSQWLSRDDNVNEWSCSSLNTIFMPCLGVDLTSSTIDLHWLCGSEGTRPWYLQQSFE